MGMTVVRLNAIKIDAVLAIVSKLTEQGLQQHVDFDFAYHPGWTSNFTNETQHVNFKFYKETLATWFAMQYSGITE
jgi:hypothetical protein